MRIVRRGRGRAAVTDFVWQRRMNLVLDDPKNEAGKGMCPCHQVSRLLTTPWSNPCSN